MWGPEELRHVDFASGGSEITVHLQCLARSLSQPHVKNILVPTWGISDPYSDSKLPVPLPEVGGYIIVWS